ncbi:MAG: hypothetical protein RLZZ385_1072 [Pseudomonadota bacterium]|jgi:hypothetical protein
MVSPTLIFSFLKLPKKTAAVLGGIMIAMACLWGIALWQDITPRQLFGLFIGSLLLVLAVMLAAVLLVLLGKGILRLLRKLGNQSQDSEGQ